MIALDTNVVSELATRRPAPRVLAWAEARSSAELALPTLVLGELFRGIRRLPLGSRRTGLEVGLSEFLARLRDRQLLAFDAIAAVEFGSVQAARESQGKPMSTMDALIAATCRAHGAVLATRNVKDFVGAGVSLVNPWEAGL